jgi:hypothetical protein
MGFPKVDLILILWQEFNYIVDVIHDYKQEAQSMSVYLCLHKFTLFFHMKGALLAMQLTVMT